MRHRLALLVAIGACAWALPATAQDAEHTMQNPYACLGAYEAAAKDHTIAQMRGELNALLARQLDADLGRDTLAVDACVIGRLKARLGDGDAWEFFEHAIALAPHEPGFEMFAGDYWSGVRGAHGPLAARAEDRYQAALTKLATLRAEGRARPFHDLVEEWVTKRLMVLHQQDGVVLLPWADPGPARWRLALGSQWRGSVDTRDFFYNNEMRRFAAEVMFANSDVRANGKLNARDAWDLARAPLRLQMDNNLRLRHVWAGQFDLVHSQHDARQTQVTNFYDPNQIFSDVQVQELGGAYTQAVALPWALDARLTLGYRRVDRVGVIEFWPTKHEAFNLFEARPSLATFVGSSKVSLDGVYVRMDLPDTTGVQDQRMRQKVIRALVLDWAIYAPVPLPNGDAGVLGLRPTPIRGWHFYAGAAQDQEVYGLRMVTFTDLYAGTRFEGNGVWDIGLQGTYLLSRSTLVDANDVQSKLYSDPTQDFDGVQLSLLPQLRVVDPDAKPGTSVGFWALDSLMVVFPLQASLTSKGNDQFRNVRGGAQAWMKLFAGQQGTAFLVTAGVDVQHFPALGKTMALGQVALRMGWGEL